jgi:hypothetical protein
MSTLYRVQKQLQGELETRNWFDLVTPPNVSNDYEGWPLETKVEVMNIILILYNLHLIPEKVYEEKYRSRVERLDAEGLLSLY